LLLLHCLIITGFEFWASLAIHHAALAGNQLFY